MVVQGLFVKNQREKMGFVRASAGEALLAIRFPEYKKKRYMYN